MHTTHLEMNHQNSAHSPLCLDNLQSSIDLKLSSDAAASPPKINQNSDEKIEENLIYREMMMEKVKANIVAAQARQKEQYDKRHHDPQIFAKGAEGFKAQKTSWRKIGFQVEYLPVTLRSVDVFSEYQLAKVHRCTMYSI